VNQHSVEAVPSSAAAPISREIPPVAVRHGHRKLWVLGAVVLAGGFFAWRIFAPHGESRAEHMRDEMEKGPVPVVAGEAQARDFPVYLDGLGTVQAFNSVTVHPRVDGEIQRIFFTEGQDVKKGDQLAQIDPRPYQAQYEQAVAKKAQDEAQLANARLVLARNEELIKSRVIDQQTYDTQRYAAQQLQALVQADQAAIDNAQTQLDYTRLLAPISGRVGIRLVDEGNVIRSADSSGIVVINQVQPISVIFTLPQQQLGQVRDALQQSGGQPLQVFAVDRNNQSVLGKGTLAVLDNQIDPTTATVKLKATFENADLRLWPGQFVNVRLLLGVKKGAVCVPDAAIQRGPSGPYVYVIGAGDTANMRSIQPGASEDGWTLIESGLTAGEHIVVEGQYRLKPGAKVTIRPQTEATPAAQ
jgi:multidrug efflux system membrane fusion protein